ncbi:MAG: DNA alkylation repair protein [Paludibacteraceae bacterium]|nr:DNA alkylation repair protein [Paludibacteraceae bacterium]
MKFLLTNPEIDQQITEIKRKIRLSMNGIVSESMEAGGIVYKQNFGVAIPRLRELAAAYDANHDLAQRLWMLKIRETMIMATLLEDPEKFSIENARQWLSDIHQSELMEQCVMNTFIKTPFANQLIADTIASEQLWSRVSGFVMAARLHAKIPDKLVDDLLSKVKQYSRTDEYHLYRSMGLCMARLCRRNTETAKKISEFCTQNLSDKNDAQRYISEEVRQEILFLNN